MIKKDTAKLVAIRMINWHACSDSGIIPLVGNVMLAGATGSGKSTLMDAIYSTLFINYNHMNKAANASSKRDLLSYVRCRIDETQDNGEVVKYKRNGKVITYVAIEVSLNGVESVLGACYTATHKSSPEKTYFVFPKKQLKDIIFLDDQNRPLEFKALLKNNHCAQTFHSNVQGESRRQFASVLGFDRQQVELYELVGEGVSKTLALDVSDVKDVSLFIKKNILKENILDIEEIEKLHNKLTDFMEQLQDLENKASSLNEIIETIDEMDRIQEEKQKWEIVKTIASVEAKKQEVDKLSDEIEHAKQLKSFYESQKNMTENQIDRNKETIHDLQRSDVSQIIKNLQNDKTRKVEKLEGHNEKVNMVNAAYTDLCNEIKKHNVLIDIPHIDTHNFAANSLAHIEASEITRDFETCVQNCIFTNNEKNKHLQEEIRELKEENEALKSGVASGAAKCAADVVYAINNYFEKNNKKDEAKMVYQCVDFSTENVEWQPAIEKMMGLSRFNIIVKPENFIIAQNIAKQEQKRTNISVTIVDTGALGEECVETGSICNLIIYHNDLAEKYIKYRFGKFIAIDTCAGVMQNSKLSYIGKDGTSSYSKKAITFSNKQIQCCIGEDARKQTIQKNDEIINDKRAEINENNQITEKLQRIKKMANVLLQRLARVEDSILREIEMLPMEITDIDNNIAALTRKHNVNDVQIQIGELQKKIEKLVREKNDLALKIEGVVKESTRSEQNLENAEQNLKVDKEKLIYYQSKMQNQFEGAMITYRDLFGDKRKTLKSVFEQLNAEVSNRESEYLTKNGSLRTMQRNYCNRHNNTISFGGIESAAEYRGEYQRVVAKDLPKLRNKINVVREEQLKEIKQTIVGHFKRCFEEAHRQIKEINAVLKKARFGNRIYSLASLEPMPTYERYYNMINDYSEENAVIRDEDEYEDLYRFVHEDNKNLDYRNFLKADVNICVHLEERTVDKKLSHTLSTGSGGETQIALYILSALALMSIYSNDNFGSNIRLMMIDEAFDKMDNQTIASMIGYLRDLGFCTILSAPDSKFATIREYMDTRIIVKTNAKGRAFDGKTNERAFMRFVDQ